MWKNPAVKIRRQLALIKHITARIVVIRRLDGWGANDLVVGKNALGVAGARHGLAGDFRACAVCANDAAGADSGGVNTRVAARLLRVLARFKVHHGHAVRVALNAIKGANTAHRTAGCGTFAQPFVKLFPVDHADKAVVDGNVHLVVAGRDHSRRRGACDQQLVGNGKVLDQPRRNRTTARLHAARAVKQQHRPPTPRQVVRSGRTGWAAADNHHIKSFISIAVRAHVVHLLKRTQIRKN